MVAMEASRPSSPEPNQVQKNSDLKSDCQRSPTTVIEETDSLYFPMPTSDASIGNNEDLTLDVASPDFKHFSVQSLDGFNIKQERYSKSRRKQRERRKYLSLLPTIQEVSEDMEHGSEENSLEFLLLSEVDDVSLHIQTVQVMIDDASQRAAQGNEEKALAIYKDGLSAVNKEVTRITGLIEASAKKEPKFEETALSIVLHEECAKNALVIADIRIRMSTIYERREDYKEALDCSEKARIIYQQHAAYDGRHLRKDSSAREKELSTEIMMEQIEEAMDSHCIRQSLHQTVERIREKIDATTDETSKGFLYEDVFDKLSTVLSLELMYLGETHPQIANTKGLLSTFYSEINQNEKALRAMNDAVLICEMALGDSHPQTGSKYQDTAKLHELIGGEDNCSKAIDLYEKAIATLERAQGNVSERLCSSLNRVAVLYIERECYDIAIKKLKRAIHISEENYRERSDDDSTEPIQLWLNLGKCQVLKGESAQAAQSSRNALRIQRDKRKFYDLSHNSPGNIPGLISNSKIVFTLKKLGESLAAELKFTEAYSCFTEALSILLEDLNTAKELAKFNPTIDLPKLEDEVASALYDLAKVKQADSKYDEAIILYKESLQMRKESGRKRAVNDRSSNHTNCAICLAGIGSIELIQNEQSEAFKSFNQAIYYAKLQGIPDSHPIALMLWDKSRIAANNMDKTQKSFVSIETANIELDDLVISGLEEKAKELRESKDFENCLKTINIVIRMKRALLERSLGQDQSAKAKQLAVSLIIKGEVALLKSEQKDATDCFNEASDLLIKSGLNQNDQSFPKFEMIHGMPRKTNRLKKIGARIKKMKRRSESTMGEF